MWEAARSSSMSEELVRALCDPTFYPEPTSSVELIETHISWVFLTERYVYKLKKPVHFDFLDFRTCEQRRRACWDELRLNRRLAEDVYLNVLPICGSGAGLAIGGTGPPRDWLVQMRRLPAEAALDRWLRSPGREADALTSLSARLNRFYAEAPRAAISPRQYREAFLHHLRANLAVLADAHDAEGDPAGIAACERLIAWLALHPDGVERRAATDRIVEGHGDLRPEHIYLLQPPVVIDCLEFSLEYRLVDPLDELAFLEMECERLGHAGIGRHLWESYLHCNEGGHAADVDLLHFYQAYRATVRAKVAYLRAAQQVDAWREASWNELRRYVRIAVRHSSALGPAWCLVVGGLSGTGKTRLAGALAEVLGCSVLSTDVVRGSLFARPSDDRSSAVQEVNRYTRRSRAAVYDRLFELADARLLQGRSVVLDGTFLEPALRRRASEMALIRGARCQIVQCRCPMSLSERRIAERQARGNSASEATAAVLRRQQWQLSPNEQVLVLDTSLPEQFLRDRVLDSLRD